MYCSGAVARAWRRRRPRVVHIVFSRPSISRPVSEFAWEAARVVAEADDCDFEVLVPVPMPIFRKLSSFSRQQKGRAAWPSGLEDALLRLTPTPTLVPFPPIPRTSIEAATAALAIPLAKRRVDLIHGSFLDEGGFAAAWLGKVLRAKSIAVAHGTEVREAALGRGTSRDRRTLYSLRTATRIVAVSRELAGSVERLGRSAEVIPFTARADRFTATPWGARPLLLFVGRVSTAKGADLLLEALSKSSRKDVIARFVGPPSPELDLRRRAEELGVAAQIELTGEVPLADMPRHYAEAACLVLPSKSEGLACVWVEAMLSGRPVITTDVGAAREVIRPENGVIVPSGDSKGLAEAIEDVIGRLGTFTPDVIRESALPLSWEQQGQRLVDLTRTLIDVGPARQKT